MIEQDRSCIPVATNDLFLANYLLEYFVNESNSKGFKRRCDFGIVTVTISFPRNLLPSLRSSKSSRNSSIDFIHPPPIRSNAWRPTPEADLSNGELVIRTKSCRLGD